MTLDVKIPVNYILQKTRVKLVITTEWAKFNEKQCKQFTIQQQLSLHVNYKKSSIENYAHH